MSSFPVGTVGRREFRSAPAILGWGTWSAQALMLPYMEQTPLYNAANFSLDNQVNDLGIADQQHGLQRQSRRVPLPVRRPAGTPARPGQQ